MRLFFAIELSEQVRAHLSRVQDELRDKDRGISWTKSENLHVTLKFIGEVEEPNVAPLCDAVKQLPRPGPIVLRAMGLQFFPPRSGARIVAAEMEGDLEQLQQVYEQLEDACARCGYARERRRYRPHVTLARPRQFLRPPQQAQLIERSENLWTGPNLTITEFVLMESQLGGARGAQYVPVARFPLV